MAILDVSGPLVIADYFVITTARNNRQAVAIARELEGAVKHRAPGIRGLRRLNVSGSEGDGGWILLDLDLVVVHIFTAPARALYDLENLWADVPRVQFQPAEKAPVAHETPKVVDDSWGSAP